MRLYPIQYFYYNRHIFSEEYLNPKITAQESLTRISFLFNGIKEWLLNTKDNVIPNADEIEPSEIQNNLLLISEQNQISFPIHFSLLLILL